MQTKKSSDFFDEDEYTKKTATPESILRQMKKENINRLVLGMHTSGKLTDQIVNRFLFINSNFPEDLRKPEVRDQLWSMYNDHIKDNSNKQLQEKKRLGLIDKKLKQYHKTEAYSPYATIQHTPPQPRPVVMRQTSDRIKLTAEKPRHSTQEPHTNRNKGRFLIDMPNEIK
jgi:hypothetical protein